MSRTETNRIPNAKLENESTYRNATSEAISTPEKLSTLDNLLDCLVTGPQT